MLNFVTWLGRQLFGLVNAVFTFGINLWTEYNKFMSALTTILLVAAMWFVWALTFVGTLLTETIDKMSAIAALMVGVNPATITQSDYFQLINTFFPLDFLFAVLILYWTFYGLTFVVEMGLKLYRLVPGKAT